MGINGLLQFLKPIQKDRHISSYARQRVAIDSYCWIHKSLYTCAVELAKGVPTDRWILFCLRKIEMLLSYNITVVAVFDGAMLPVKKLTEVERENSRREARRKADELLKQGQHDLAYRKFAESIDVTPELAIKLFKILREKYSIECIVSPYEADAQLAYLSRTNYIDVIITEDSDLLAFGAKKVFYKMDQSGNGSEIVMEDYKSSKELKMYDWDDKMFLTACIMSGCDYLPSIKGIGMKTAYKLISEYRTYRKIIDSLKFDGKYEVPPSYLEDFERAFITFRFQNIFCPKKQKLLMLIGSDLDELKSQLYDNHSTLLLSESLESLIESDLLLKMLTLRDLNFLGPVIPEQLAKDIAYGIIDPISLNPYLCSGKSAAGSSINKNSSPVLPQRTKSLDSGHMLEKTSGEKYYKVAKPVNSYPAPERKSESQLSIVNFVNINGRRSNVQISQSTKSEKIGEKFVLDFLMNNENSNSLQFRPSKGLKAPYKPPKGIIRSLSLDIGPLEPSQVSIKPILNSAPEEIKEADMHLEVSETFGSPFAFLKKDGKKRRQPSHNDDVLDDVESKKENETFGPEDAHVLKKSRTSLDASASKRKTSDEFAVEIGNYSKLISNLGAFAFKQNPSKTMQLDEEVTIKDTNLKSSEKPVKVAIAPKQKALKRVSFDTQSSFLQRSSTKETNENEDSNSSLVVRKLYRQFSDGLDSGRTHLSLRFRELVDTNTNIDFEGEEVHNIVDIEKKLQRLEILFDYKKPVIDFKQALAHPA